MKTKLKGLIEDESFLSGAALIVLGLVLAAFFFAVSNTPLAAIGLACVIIGLTVVLTPPTPVPGTAARSMLEGASLNLEALLEEFNVEGRATYMPPRDGRVTALIPMSQGSARIETAGAAHAPLRVLTSIGGKPVLTIFPPGSEVVRLAGVAQGASIEDALRLVLVEFLEAADSVKASLKYVAQRERVFVQITGSVINTELPRIKRSLGSPTTSIAGCALAQAMGRMITFAGEVTNGDTISAEFEVS